LSDDGKSQPKGRRRRARTALVVLRRRITRACDKLKSAEDFYAKLSAYVAPVLAEFGDSLPSGARGNLENVRQMAEARSADAGTTCRLCKGQLKDAIKDVSNRLGVEGKIRDALSPLEEIAPGWLVASPVAQVIAVAVTVVAGGGLAAAVAMTAGGGGGVDTVSNSTPSTAAAPSPSPSGNVAGGGALPDPCELVTTDDAAAVLGGTVDSTASPPSESTRSCLYELTDADPSDCRYVLAYVSSDASVQNAEREAGLGDEAYWIIEDGAQLIARRDDLWVTLDVWSSTDCTRTDAPVAQSRADARDLTRIALERL